MIDVENVNALQSPRLAEMSRKSFEVVNGQWNVHPREHEKSRTPRTDPANSFVHLDSKNDGSTVVAVDVSSRSLGETRRGQIGVFRGSIVWREEGTYRYFRYGPYVFGIPNDYPTKSSSYAFLQIQNEMESEIKAKACELASNSIVLFDGCLHEFGQETHSPALSAILRIAHRNSNSVLAISKHSVLESLEDEMIAVNRTPGPILLKQSLMDEASPNQLGWIFLAKLARKSLPFRLDVDKAQSAQEAIRSAERLLGNDIMMQGYPETLRLAHIFSIFTESEIIVLQSQLAKQCGLLDKSTNVRRLLFGPYGKWDD
ncbi:MAG: hypothetical protein ACE5KO_00750 [Candidatus Bathyarchaeia archaeon]